MNCESLYEQFKWKKYHQQTVQEREIQRIKLLAQAPKTNPKSNFILNTKLFEQLEHFPDSHLVTLETSIPILHSVHILEIISSLEEAREKLKNHDHQHERLKWEGKFLIELWRVIDEEEIETRTLKQIIYLLYEKKGRQLREILCEMFNSNDGIDDLLEAWKELRYDRQYYKKPHKQEFEVEKQNSLQYSEIKGPKSRQKKIHSPLDKNQSAIHKPLGQTNSFISKGLGYSCFLSADKEKQLVDRLYKNDKYRNREELKRQKQQQKEKEELQHCTFKPKTNYRARSRSASQNKHVKGYNKAIDRMRTGAKKNKEKKELRQYKPIGENYEKLREKGINPPSFLNRKKQQEKVLFMISFDLGRYKTNVKIREGQSEQMVAERLCKIYSLRQDYFTQICKIVRSELEQYYREQLQKQIYKDYGQQ